MENGKGSRTLRRQIRRRNQTDLKFAGPLLNAEGAEVLAEDAKVIVFLCDLCEFLRVLCVKITGREQNTCDTL